LPQEIREGYMQKLLKRKNSAAQKNVALLKTIYEHIRTDNIISWDEDKISAELGITKDMLYCHKTWLLKGIRKFYFNRSENKTSAKFRIDYNRDQCELNRAKSLIDTGMRREAKSILLSLERKLLAKQRNSEKDKVILFYISRYLCQYFYSIKSENKFRKYSRLAVKHYMFLLRKAKAANVQPDPDLKINYCYCRSFMATYHVKHIEDLAEGRKYLEEALEETGKREDKSIRSDLLMNIANIYTSEPGGFLNAEKFAAEGISNAAEYGSTAEIYAFKIVQLHLKFLQKQIDAEGCIKKLNEYFILADKPELKPSFRRIILTKAVFLSSSYRDSSVVYHYFQKLNSMEILNFGFDSSFRSLYSAKLKLYTDNLFIMQPEEFAGTTCLIAKTPDPHNLKKLHDTIEELLLNFRKIPDFYFIKEMYLYMLIAALCSGRNFDTGQFAYITRKIEWLNKSRGKAVEIANKKTFELVKFFSAMMENVSFVSKQEFISRYYKEFSEKISTFLENPSGSHYGLCSFIAEQTGYTEFKEIIRNLYSRLVTKYPAYFRTENITA